MESRNSCRDGNWRLSKLEDFNHLGSFDCDDKDLNDFFRNDALAHKNELLAEIYSFSYQKATGDVQYASVAFVSFHNDTIQLSWKEKKELIPKDKWYPTYPAVKIGRLGVVKELQGNNIGTQLLNLAKKFFVQDNRTGCRFITVDAYNQPKCINFYKSNGFQFLRKTDEKKSADESPTVTMFFDLKRFVIE